MIGNKICNDISNTIQCNYDGGDCCGPMVANGVCQDDLNIPQCAFDGGDCCGSCVITTDCSECECLIDGYVADNSIQSHSIGNGLCEDELNNIECDFDGGDCCGACINIEFCTECECLGKESKCKCSYRFCIYISLNCSIL